MGWLGTSRGCTWFPEGAHTSCCEQHDRDYGVGGTKTRAQADEDLRRCVTAAHSEQGVWVVIAWGMWGLLRLGGWVKWYWIRRPNKKGAADGRRNDD